MIRLGFRTIPAPDFCIWVCATNDFDQTLRHFHLVEIKHIQIYRYTSVVVFLSLCSFTLPFPSIIPYRVKWKLKVFDYQLLHMVFAMILPSFLFRWSFDPYLCVYLILYTLKPFSLNSKLLMKSGVLKGNMY